MQAEDAEQAIRAAGKVSGAAKGTVSNFILTPPMSASALPQHHIAMLLLRPCHPITPSHALAGLGGPNRPCTEFARPLMRAGNYHSVFFLAAGCTQPEATTILPSQLAYSRLTGWFSICLLLHLPAAQAQRRGKGIAWTMVQTLTLALMKFLRRTKV